MNAIVFSLIVSAELHIIIIIIDQEKLDEKPQTNEYLFFFLIDFKRLVK